MPWSTKIQSLCTNQKGGHTSYIVLKAQTHITFILFFFGVFHAKLMAYGKLMAINCLKIKCRFPQNLLSPLFTASYKQPSY